MFHHEIWESVFSVLMGHRSQVKRTSDGGNGNRSVSLPIILIKI